MSNLKYSVTASSPLSTQINRTTSSPSPQKKQKMSLSQTYMLAHTARSKLSKEASRADHNLRRLVGHANMLDDLMLDLANAEEEQENWFNQSVQSAKKVSHEPKHIQWAASIPEEAVDEEEASDSESDDEDYQVAQQIPFRKVAKTPPPPPAAAEDSDDEMEDDDDYEDDLALTRTFSHPPELMHEDSDSESEDESMPPSPPPTAAMSFEAFSEKQRQAIATTSFYQSEKSLPQADTLGGPLSWCLRSPDTDGFLTGFTNKDLGFGKSRG
ncbi:uncharacterized protein KY384_005478 [Bacidia gigantensis]|uniref:uncharacterized protein n=1 Tax=Bacidia gigantensis TaxID=2732470 RepID=UPI001D04413E|nr:uncharacterized protein KY384_005478 [Bacidia gigantensis]KAG8529996.1 hypothetical protein KY384_005478 [Bacidia gigantensis]